MTSFDEVVSPVDRRELAIRSDSILRFHEAATGFKQKPSPTTFRELWSAMNQAARDGIDQDTLQDILNNIRKEDDG